VDRLGDEFTCIVTEVAALYYGRSGWLEQYRHEDGMQRLCNTQADLEGRLHGLRQRTFDDMQISCIIAAFLCVYAFWTDIWSSALIPRVLSAQLLHHVRRWKRSSYESQDGIFTWVWYVGKAFAVDARVRNGLDQLHRSREAVSPDSTSGSMPELRLLNTFIWSECFYNAQTGWFWQSLDSAAW